MCSKYFSLSLGFAKFLASFCISFERFSKLLKFYEITDPSNTNKENNSIKKDKIFILSGEHPRELIAVETLFHFLNFICKNKDSENIKNLLFLNHHSKYLPQTIFKSLFLIFDQKII